MKNNYPHIAQITQTGEMVTRAVGFKGCKGYHTETSKPSLIKLCNLRNLRRAQPGKL